MWLPPCRVGRAGSFDPCRRSGLLSGTLSVWSSPCLIGRHCAGKPTLMGNSGSLFDQIDRDSAKEPGESASRFERVNRSNRPSMHRVRNLWEDWYARFPDRSSGLRSRFRGDDHNHDGAVFELFLHQLFTRLGLSVDVEPQLEDGRSPDFLVSGADSAAYVEATYLKQSFATLRSKGRCSTRSTSWRRMCRR